MQPHILVTRFSALGDVAMLVPVVQALAHQYPDVRITVLSQGFLRPLFEAINHSEEPHATVHFVAGELRGKHRGIKGLNLLYRELRDLGITHVADMHSVLRTHYMRLRFRLGGYKVERINKNREGKRALVREKNKRMEQQPTSFQNYADVLARLGFPIQPDLRPLISAQTQTDVVPAELQTKLSNAQRNIGIAPFAAHAGKVYPLDMMQQVVNQLAAHADTAVYLFGAGDEETSVMRQWQEGHDNIHIVGDYIHKNLFVEVVFMSRLTTMLTMDSGNQHLAALSGCRLLSIWGATHPYAGFLGLGQRDEHVIQLPLPCRPCSVYGKKPCIYGDLRCMRNITPETIINKVLQK